MTVHTPARYGNGFMYAVEMPGVEQPHILCDERTLEEMSAEAAAQDHLFFFRGVETQLALADGNIVTGVVGVGRIFAGAESGVLIRYHDGFTGPPTGDDDDGDEGEAAEEPPARPAPSPSPFNLGGRSRS